MIASSTSTSRTPNGTRQKRTRITHGWAKEKDVSDEALYALGFRLLESGDGSNEELGAELLQGIIDERPRSKLAKAAKNKLKLTGHADE